MLLYLRPPKLIGNRWMLEIQLTSTVFSPRRHPRTRTSTVRYCHKPCSSSLKGGLTTGQLRVLETLVAVSWIHPSKAFQNDWFETELQLALLDRSAMDLISTPRSKGSSLGSSMCSLAFLFFSFSFLTIHILLLSGWYVFFFFVGGGISRLSFFYQSYPKPAMMNVNWAPLFFLPTFARKVYAV